MMAGLKLGPSGQTVQLVGRRRLGQLQCAIDEAVEARGFKIRAIGETQTVSGDHPEPHAFGSGLGEILDLSIANPARALAPELKKNLCLARSLLFGPVNQSLGKFFVLHATPAF